MSEGYSKREKLISYVQSYYKNQNASLKAGMRGHYIKSTPRTHLMRKQQKRTRPQPSHNWHCNTVPALTSKVLVIKGGDDNFLSPQ